MFRKPKYLFLTALLLVYSLSSCKSRNGNPDSPDVKISSKDSREFTGKSSQQNSDLREITEEFALIDLSEKESLTIYESQNSALEEFLFFSFGFILKGNITEEIETDATIISEQDFAGLSSENKVILIEYIDHRASFYKSYFNFLLEDNWDSILDLMLQEDMYTAEILGALTSGIQRNEANKVAAHILASEKSKILSFFENYLSRYSKMPTIADRNELLIPQLVNKNNEIVENIASFAGASERLREEINARILSLENLRAGILEQEGGEYLLVGLVPMIVGWMIYDVDQDTNMKVLKDGIASPNNKVILRMRSVGWYIEPYEIGFNLLAWFKKFTIFKSPRSKNIKSNTLPYPKKEIGIQNKRDYGNLFKKNKKEIKLGSLAPKDFKKFTEFNKKRGKKMLERLNDKHNLEIKKLNRRRDVLASDSYKELLRANFIENIILKRKKVGSEKMEETLNGFVNKKLDETYLAIDQKKFKYEKDKLDLERMITGSDVQYASYLAKFHLRSLSSVR